MKSLMDFIKDRKGQGFMGLVWLGIFFVGVILVAGVSLKYVGVIGVPAAIVTSATGIPLAVVPGVAPTDATTLQQQLLAIERLSASGILGRTSTANIKAFNTVASSSTEVTDSINASVFVSKWNPGKGSWNGYVKVKDKDTYSLGDAGISLAVGDKMIVTGIDTGYYCDNVLKGKDNREVLISQSTENFEMNCQVHSSDSSMKIQGRDDTGTSELSGPTNGSQENGDISAIAGETVTYYLEYKNNDDNSMRRVCAIGIIGTNESKRNTPMGITKVVGGAVTETATLSKSKPVWANLDAGCPDHMCDVSLNTSQSGQSGWEDVWYITSASTHSYLEIEGSEQVKLQMKTKIGSDDPMTSQTISIESKTSVIFKDCANFEARDGSNAFGIADNTDDEADVGVGETDTNVISLASGTSAALGPIYSVEFI